MQPRPTETSLLAIVALVAALLACGGRGDDDACRAELDYRGKRAAATGQDRLSARHSACVGWCEAHATDKSHRDAINACASRCGGDVMFGRGKAQVTCK